MKKKTLTLLMFAGLTVSSLAQSDSFFDYQQHGNQSSRNGTAEGYNINGTSAFGINPMNTQQNLPLNGGLLLLAAAGLGYAALKRKEETK